MIAREEWAYNNHSILNKQFFNKSQNNQSLSVFNKSAEKQRVNNSNFVRDNSVERIPSGNTNQKINALNFVRNKSFNQDINNNNNPNENNRNENKSNL
jgi:hypothetical protein